MFPARDSTHGLYLLGKGTCHSNPRTKKVELFKKNFAETEFHSLPSFRFYCSSIVLSHKARYHSKILCRGMVPLTTFVGDFSSLRGEETLNTVLCLSICPSDSKYFSLISLCPSFSKCLPTSLVLLMCTYVSLLVCFYFSQVCISVSLYSTFSMCLSPSMILVLYMCLSVYLYLSLE